MKLTACLLWFLPWVACYAQQSEANSLLWRISGNGLQKPSYLFGTLHEREKYLFYFSDSVYQAIETTEMFGREDDDSIEGRFIADRIMANYHTTAIPDSTEEIFYRPIDAKGWRRISRSFFYKDTDKSLMPVLVDFYLDRIARQKGKSVVGLEWPGEKEYMRMHLGDNASLTPKQTDQLRALSRDYYHREDINSMRIADQLMYTDRGMHIVLNQRNQLMAARIDSILQSTTGFFAVGVSHLPGDSGMIRLLRQKGYSVSPVFSKRKLAPLEWDINKDTWHTSYSSDGTYSLQMPAPVFELPGEGKQKKVLFSTYKASRINYSFREIGNPFGNEENMPDQLWLSLQRQGFTVQSVTAVEKNFDYYFYFFCTNIFEGQFYKIRAVGNRSSYYFLMAAVSASYPKSLLDQAEPERFFMSFQKD